MAKNFEIIINMDCPITMADGSKHLFMIDEALEILKTKNVRWVCAPHIPDEMSSFNHWHLGFSTNSCNTYDTIASWFNLPVNAVQKIRGRFDSTYLLYIIHYNKEGKTPVSTDLVRSNFNLDYDELIHNVERASNVDSLCDDIVGGKIRRYNYTDYIDSNTWIKNERRFESAFRYREDKLRNASVNRTMECVFITGESGCGKTTYAKEMAKQFGSVFVSSSTNDPLDGYNGQEVVILDDLRASSFALSDLLKLLVLY